MQVCVAIVITAIVIVTMSRNITITTIITTTTITITITMNLIFGCVDGDGERLVGVRGEVGHLGGGGGWGEGSW